MSINDIIDAQNEKILYLENKLDDALYRVTNTGSKLACSCPWSIICRRHMDYSIQSFKVNKYARNKVMLMDEKDKKVLVLTEDTSNYTLCIYVFPETTQKVIKEIGLYLESVCKRSNIITILMCSRHGSFSTNVAFSMRRKNILGGNALYFALIEAYEYYTFRLKCDVKDYIKGTHECNFINILSNFCSKNSIVLTETKKGYEIVVDTLIVTIRNSDYTIRNKDTLLITTNNEGQSKDKSSSLNSLDKVMTLVGKAMTLNNYKHSVYIEVEKKFFNTHKYFKPKDCIIYKIEKFDKYRKFVEIHGGSFDVYCKYRSQIKIN